MKRLELMGLMAACAVTGLAGAEPWQEQMWLGRGGYWRHRVKVTVTNPTDKAVSDGSVAVRIPALKGTRSAEWRVVEADGTELEYGVAAPDTIVVPAKAEAKSASSYFVYWDNPDAWELIDPWPRGDEPKSGLVASAGAVERLELKELDSDAPWDAGDWDYRVGVRVCNFTEEYRRNVMSAIDADEVLRATRAPAYAVRHGGRSVPAFRSGSVIVFPAEVPPRSVATYWFYVKGGKAAEEDRAAFVGFVRSPANLLREPFFEEDGKRWTKSLNKGVTVDVLEDGTFGRVSRLVSTSAKKPGSWVGRSQRVNAKPGRTYLVGAMVRGTNAPEGTTVHFHLEGKGKTQYCSVPEHRTGTFDWTPMFAVARMPQDGRTVSIHLTTSSTGTLDHTAAMIAEVCPSAVGRIEARPLAAGAFAAAQVPSIVKVFRETPVREGTDPWRIALARNETEELQVAVRSGTGGEVGVEMSEPVNAAGDRLPVETGVVGFVPVDFPTAYYQRETPERVVRTPNHPKACDGFSGWWPDPVEPGSRIPLKANEAGSVRFSVRAGGAAAAGVYRAEVRWSRDGKVFRCDPVEVEVWDFALPGRPDFAATYDVRLNRPWWRAPGETGDGPAKKRVMDAMAKHLLCPDRIDGRVAFRRGKDGRVTADFSDYDRAAAEFFDAYRFPSSYMPQDFYCFGWGHPPKKFLGEEPYDGAYPFENVDRGTLRAAYKAVYQQALRLYWEHVKAKGWADRLVLYISDEPFFHTPAVRDQMIALCRMIHEVDPAIRIYSSTWRHCPEWDDALDVWGVGAHGCFPTAEMVRLSGRGKGIWFTTDGHQCLDTPTCAIERMQGIFCWAYGAEKYEFWGCTWLTADPWRFGWHKFIRQTDVPGKTQWVRYPAGDGYHFYPPRDAAKDATPVPSIRVQAIRDGVEAVGYLKALESRAAKGDAAARSLLDEYRALVPIPNAGGRYSTRILPEPERLDALRLRAGRLLSLADVAGWDFSDTKGWRTSSPAGGRVLASGGPDGSAALGVEDAGTNNCKWLSPPVTLQPRRPYGFTAKVKVSGKGGGITYGTPAQNVTDNASGVESGWRELRTVVVAADRPNAYGETFRLGEYHLDGCAAFDDARVVALTPVYARGADGLELGHGERVAGTRYFFHTGWGTEGRNHARPLESLAGATYNSGNVDVYPGTSVTFRHELAGRVWKSASVVLSTPRPIRGEGLEARADEGAWMPLAAETNASGVTATLPASLFPARTIRVRFAPHKGGGGRLTGYSFKGEFAGPEATLAGWTRYLDAASGREFTRVDAPVFYRQGYGAVLAAPGAPFTAWTALSGWKIPRDHPAPSAQTDVVRVSAAANEAEAVQLVLRANEDISRVRVTCGTLAAKDGAALPASAVEIFREGYVSVASAKDRVGCAGDWPDPLFDQNLAPTVHNPEGVRAGENAPFWVRVTVPKGTPGGVYSGTLAADVGSSRYAFPLEVEVYGFELPDKLSCRTAFGMGTRHIDVYHRVKDNADRERIHDLYFRSLAAHRISPYDPAPGAHWKASWKDGEPVIDWSGWDGPVEAALAKYGFDGFRIQGLGLGGGSAHSRWPGRVPGTNVTETMSAYEPLMAKFLKAFEGHFREKGWLDKAYLYCYDEPRACDDPFVRRGLGLVAKYAPGIDRLLTAPVRDELVGGPNVWCPVASSLGYPREAERRAAGDRMWLYVCMFPKPPYPSLFIDHPGVDLRVWLWQCWREKVEGVLVWNTTWWTSPLPYPDPARPQNPYRDTIAWSPSIPGQGASNGDGRFFYPPPRSCAAFDAGEDCGPIFEKPVETMRLEYVRDGLEDYEYFAMLKRLDPTNALLAVPSEVSASPVEFSVDPAHMAAHRAKLAREIERLSRAGEEILKDPSFESGTAPFGLRLMEKGWTPTQDQNDPRYTSGPDATHVKSGKSAWRLGCTNPTGRSIVKFAGLPVKPATRYVFRANYWFDEKSERPLLVWGNVLQQDASGKGHCAYFNCPHYDTHVGRWNALEIPFYAATNAATANVELIFGGKSTVWLDDFSFVEEPEPAPAAPVGGILSDGEALSVGWLMPFSKTVPKGFPEGLKPSADGKIRLDTAKSEKESFQLVLVARRAMKGVSVRLTGVDFPVKVREVKFVPIANAKNPSMNRLHPDPLPPFAKGDVAAGENLTLYLTVTTPATAAAGTKAGAVEVLSEGAVVARVPLEIRVRNFALPEHAALKSYFYAGVGYGGKAYQTFDPRPAGVIEDEIHRLYGEIRLTGNQAWDRPKVKWELKDGHVVVTDWSAYDRGVEKLHREYGFTSIPYPMVGMLGDNSGWFGGREPKKKPSGRVMGTKPRATPFGGYFDDETGISRVVDFARQFVAHAKERFPAVSFYWYIYDEVPMDVAPQLAPILKRLEDDVPGINLFMVSTPNAETLPHYQVRTAPFDASNLGDANPNYDESWYYQYPTTIVDGAYLRNRLFPWQVYAAKGTGVLLWNVIYYGDGGGKRKKGAHNPWSELTAFYDHAQPTILYPPRPGTDEGVVPSIRALMVGDAIDDFDYLKLLEAKVGREATMRLVSQVAPKPLEWNRDPQQLLAIRRAIADALERESRTSSD